MDENIKKRDQSDEQAERLLPCRCLLKDYKNHTHAKNCPANYRQAVAAALRGMDSDRHQQLLACDAKWKVVIADLRAENERLKALATCLCGDGFTADDPGRCGNCTVQYRIEIEKLKAQLAYAAPSVDHTCLAAESLGDHDCRRCAIDRMLDKE